MGLSDDSQGTLYVVATPIGNLGDITYRAIEILRRCPVVAAEDTRRFRILAERYGLRPRRVVRCDERSETRAAEALLASAAAGEEVALTTDAGTPGVADPGYRTVRLALERGVPVVPVPGACAPVAALSASGLPTDRFLFAGFTPRAAARRRAFLEPLLVVPATLILFESPGRLAGLLKDLAELAAGREVVVARELTKIHETFVRGSAREVGQALDRGVRGEVVVLVEGPRERAAESGAGAAGERLARSLLDRPWARELSRRDLADLLSVACGLGRNAAYRLAAAVGRAEG
jgi:16S rRNA (cytidine1402-2'-O)-methyltransferase